MYSFFANLVRVSEQNSSLIFNVAIFRFVQCSLFLGIWSALFVTHIYYSLMSGCVEPGNKARDNNGSSSFPDRYLQSSYAIRVRENTSPHGRRDNNIVNPGRAARVPVVVLPEQYGLASFRDNSISSLRETNCRPCMIIYHINIYPCVCVCVCGSILYIMHCQECAVTRRLLVSCILKNKIADAGKSVFAVEKKKPA